MYGGAKKTLIMPKYKVKMVRTREGKKLDWEREKIVESAIIPRIGEGRVLMVYPPIRETIESVEEVCPVCTSEAIGEAFGENECFNCYAKWPISN
jgi:hypothetical protein